MKFSKGKSIAFFICTIILVVALGLLTIFGVDVKGMKKGSAKGIILGLDLKGGVSFTYKIKDENPTGQQIEDTKQQLRDRVSTFSKDVDVYQEGDDKLTVDIPGVYDAQSVAEELSKPGSIRFVTMADAGATSDETYEIYANPKDGQSYKVWVDGDDISNATANAQTSQEKGTTEYVVSLTLNEEGRTKFADATSQNLNKPIYILYNDEIISAPTVQAVISDGNAVINGQASMEEAEKLASTIRIGTLKLDLEQYSSKVVSARLGNDAIKTSLIAAAIGIAIVIIFMLFMYRVSGIASGIALVLYTILELLVLNGFDLTLTLPGIAGIILSIGMAVDANVIIYARIKEELKAGRPVDVAIKTGFKKATSAIVDGNVTTFIASLVLMKFGSGPVQGFAITLAIGIVLSMFTAMVVSRFLANCLYGMGFQDKKYYGIAKERKTIDFLSKKAIWLAISAVVICAGFVAMGINAGNKKGAFNYSIEFVGGTTTTVDFEKEYTIDDFNNTIKPEIEKIINSSDIQGQKETGSNKYVIKTRTLTEDEQVQLRDLMINNFSGKLQEGETNFESSSVSSTFGKQMKKDAVIAVVLATLCMLVYITIRFRNVKFAGSAVLALIHDVLVVIGFYAISRLSVGTTFIACVLTIVGYSINATIVIFDRIRENLADKRDDQVDLKDVVNASITQTLTRSIYTSFTTFVTIAALFILGVASVREFALPIIVGIIAGGYSSVFVTGTLWYMMSKNKYGKKSK